MGYYSSISGVMWVINIITIVMILQMHSMKKRDMNEESMEIKEGKGRGMKIMNLGMILVLNVITSGVICGGWVYEARIRAISNNKSIRKPRNWPIVGCQIEASLNYYRLHDWCHNFFSTHTRTVELKFFTTRIYLTVDPANVKHILKTNFRNYPKDLLLSMTMDSISRVGFGIQGGKLYTFTSAFDKANAMISKRFVNVWWKAHKTLRWGIEKVLLEELANLNSFTLEVIANRRAELNNLPSTNIQSNTISSKEKGDILSRLMAIGGDSSTEKDLRDSIVNFTLAGRDTTAVTMSWLIYNMCKRKEVADKIYQEVKGVICCDKPPCYRTRSLDMFKEVADFLTFEALSQMHYLHAALTETLRLHPAVARDTKVAIYDDILPDGTCIKKGDHVAYVPYSMGRMEFLWGCDVLEFKPERWLKDGQFSQVSPFKFTSFQAGPRMCLGKDWAYLQMKMAMALLVYFFEFRLVPNHVVTYQVKMVLAIANGLQVFVHNRTTH